MVGLLVVAAKGTMTWWAATMAIVLVIILLVLAVCWMAKYTDASEVQSPLLTWKRRGTSGRKP
jgi:uncharacterized integral membrane protein